MALAPMRIAIIALLAIGVAAASYVVLTATGGPASGGLERFRTGALDRLVVLDRPPPQTASPFVAGLASDGGGLVTEPTSLEQYRGQVVLLNLWATWCAPCVAEMPALDRLQASFDADAFRVVPVSFDRRIEDAAAFYQDNAIASLGLYHDQTMGLGQAVAVEGQPLGLPTSVLYDRRGREVARIYSDVAWDSAEAVALVQAVIDGA